MGWVTTYDGLGNGLTDGVNLGNVSTTGDTDADVDTSCRKGCQRLFDSSHERPLIPSCFPPHFSRFGASSIHHHSSSPFRLFSGQNTSRTELVKTEDKDRLVDLEPQDLGLNERKRLSVDLDETLAGLAVGDSGGGPLLAEALHALGG